MSVPTASERQSLIAAAQQQVEQRQMVKVATRIELAKMYPGRTTRDSLSIVNRSPSAMEQLVRRIGYRVNGTDT